MDSAQTLKNIIKRERKARKAAEQIIEEKSLELYLANQELKNLNESLEEKIYERTREIELSREALRMAKEKAEDATKAKSEFLSNMSHEIRTPLNAILGLTELIIRDSKDSTAQEFASSMKNSASNLLHIINEILDFSKIEAGKITFERIEFDLQELFKGLNDVFAHKAVEKSLKLVFEIDQMLPKRLIGDSVKLTQILINLIGNAFKFTHNGYIRIYCKLQKKKGRKIRMMIRVEDTGIGIAKSKQHEIFETFTQANASTTRKYGGTGLGLAITRKLIELQGGKIGVESEEGVGTTFSFELDMDIGSEVEKPKTAEPVFDDSSLKELRILVVEDVAVNRFLMKQIFKRKDISPDFAENGKIAIEILAQKEYDIVLMDLHMPVMDGKQATRFIRDVNSPILNHHIPIIALTADAFQETRKEVIELGMDGFLSKPVEIDQLYNLLREMFSDY